VELDLIKNLGPFFAPPASLLVLVSAASQGRGEARGGGET